MPNAVVMTGYGPPEVLTRAGVPLPEPGEGQIRIKVKAAGVSPTDLALRAGYLKDAIPLPPDAVLGFEAAGTVDAAGPGVAGASAGDGVAALLFGLGGYAEYAVASIWARKPGTVSWLDAAALPASAEAAAGVLRQLNLTSGQTLLLAGGGVLLSGASGQLAQRIGPRPQLVAGCLSCAVASMLAVRIGPHAGYWTAVFPVALLFGLGLASLVPPLTASAMNSAPDTLAGLASGVNNAVARVAGLLWIAALPPITGLTGAACTDPVQFQSSFAQISWICAAAYACAAVLAATFISGPRRPTSPARSPSATRPGRTRRPNSGKATVRSCAADAPSPSRPGIDHVQEQA